MLQQTEIETLGIYHDQPCRLLLRLLQDEHPLRPAAAEIEVFDLDNGWTAFVGLLDQARPNRVEQALRAGSSCQLNGGYRLGYKAMSAVYDLLSDNGVWSEGFAWLEAGAQTPLGARSRLSSLGV